MVKLGKLVSSLVLTVSIEDAVIDMGEGQTAGGLEVSLVSADEGINRGISKDQPVVSILLYQSGEALPLQLALLVERVVAQPALLGALRQRVVAVGCHDVPGLQELDRPVLLVIGKALYDAGQVLVGVLAALHSRGAKDWTIAGFVRPVLKWSVKSGTSNGPLAILLARSQVPVCSNLPREGELVVPARVVSQLFLTRVRGVVRSYHLVKRSRIGGTMYYSVLIKPGVRTRIFFYWLDDIV